VADQEHAQPTQPDPVDEPTQPDPADEPTQPDPADEPSPSSPSAQPDTFPRQWARTQRLTLGEPRTVTVGADGSRVVFLRSRGGHDPVTCLWVLDVATGQTRLVADPVALLSAADEDGAEVALPPEERARRERAREQAGGITAYATDPLARVVAFALGGRLFVGGLLSGAARELAVEGPVFDPRPDPTCRRVAYVRGRTLRIGELDGTSRQLAGEEDPDVSWGSAEFVAAEEMGRSRGYWWAPDGERLAVARVDNGPVATWHVADPAQPWQAPSTLRYPAAGTANADVSLHVIALDGTRTALDWDRDALPYLVDARWDDAGPLLVTVQSRDQRRVVVLEADPDTGATSVVDEQTDPVWVEIVPGVPARLGDGRLVTTRDDAEADRRVLVVGGTPVTSEPWHVRAVASVGADRVVLTASDPDEPTEVHVLTWSETDGLARLTHGPGVHGATAGGDVVVVRSTSMEVDGAVTKVLRGTTAPVEVAELASLAETPLVQPSVTFLKAGARRLATAVLLPGGREPDRPLPVLLDPYGGPHAQRVLRARASFFASQWLADQGFVVVVADGRGTPGRGPAWERAVHRDLATAVLDDQIEALHAVARERGYLDLERVGIRGWSFGGYLAALAVLRRPDVFAAAVAGAPVTEWRWYDTHYTERYLGNPNDDAAPYDATSLLPDAPKLTRPLLLIHGLADDNVVAAHTLQLSSALLAAGRDHQVLPLSGVTHMTPQEVVAENLLHLQLLFLRAALDTNASSSLRS